MDAEEKLNNLARILSEPEEEEEKEPTPKESQFIDRAMAMIRAWKSKINTKLFY